MPGSAPAPVTRSIGAGGGRCPSGPGRPAPGGVLFIVPLRGRYPPASSYISPAVSRVCYRVPTVHLLLLFLVVALLAGVRRVGGAALFVALLRQPRRTAA